MRRLALGAALVCAATACPNNGSPPGAAAFEDLGTSTNALNGVPTNGYPNYSERMTLVAINRARSDPNNPTLQTAGKGCTTACPGPGTGRSDCYTPATAQPPLMFNYDGSRASRFHCQNLQKMNFGLSHSSPCTLRTDIGSTGCDGTQSCACASNANPNMCGKSGDPPMWTGGTDPWDRCSYFGYSASGEVGAAGYGTAWDAVYGWVGECANYEGHRMILTSSSYNQTGCGYSLQTSPTTCWSRYYFCDPGWANGLATAMLPAGVHSPETGGASTSFSFYVNYYSTTGAPQSVQLVLDGTCYPMSREIGTDGNATYLVSRVLGDTACHRYWFLAKDSAGTRSVWPEVGSWGVGSCTDYVSTAAAAACEGCVPGAACTASSGCQTGTTTCPAGTCDNLTSTANGTSCGTDKVCLSGACVSCVAGGTCSSTDNCKTGTYSCATGQQVCNATTNRSNGFVCGTDRVCLSGACVGCVAGGACSSTDNCKTGTYSCATGQQVCNATTNRSNGFVCGTDKVCSSGACVSCVAGGACSSTDNCKTGTYSCATGQQVCNATANRSDGFVCGTDKVCLSGACVGCVAGGACTSADKCKSGSYSCSTGQQVCSLTGNVANGTSCGSNQVCYQGTCNACSTGAACDSTDGCKTGSIACTSGQPVCGSFSNKTDGTPCGSGVCNGGVCSACASGSPCQSLDGCQSGLISCSTGTAVCSSLVPVANGTPCPGGVCSAGLCLPPADAGTVPPDAATPPPPDASAVIPPDAATPIPPDANLVVPPDASTVVPPDAQAAVPPDATAVVPPDAQVVVPADAAVVAPPDAELVAGDAEVVVVDAEALAPDATAGAADTAPPAGPDAQATAPADAASVSPPDAAGDLDPTATIVAGCGCSTSASAPLWTGLALLLLALRRRRS